MDRSRSLASLLLLLLLAQVLAGCWDRREVEDIAFVHAMGLDLAPDNHVTVTVQIAIPRALGAGHAGGGPGAGDAPPVLVETVTEQTVTQALRNLETFSSRRISLVHLKAVIFGEELARERVGKHLGILTRGREMRRNIMLMVAEGRAQDILTVKPDMERDPGLFLLDLTRRAFERTARAPRQDIHDFLLAYETRAQDGVLPIIRSRDIRPGLEDREESINQLLGTAVFQGEQMVGILDPEETETLIFLLGNMGSFVETIPTPDAEEFRVALELTGEERSVELDTSGPVPRFRIHLHTEGDLREIQEGHAGLVTDEGLRQMEQILARQFEAKTNALIQKLQQEYGSDALGLGHLVKARFIDWPSWERYNWKERYPDAEIQVTVDVTIRRIGMTFEPAQPR